MPRAERLLCQAREAGPEEAVAGEAPAAARSRISPATAAVSLRALEPPTAAVPWAREEAAPLPRPRSHAPAWERPVSAKPASPPSPPEPILSPQQWPARARVGPRRPWEV